MAVYHGGKFRINTARRDLYRICALLLGLSIILMCCIGNNIVKAEEQSQDSAETDETKSGGDDEWKLLEFTSSIFDQCAKKDIIVCLKEKAVRFIDTLSGDYEITDSVRLVRIADTANETAPAYDASSSSSSTTSQRSMPSGETQTANGTLESINSLPSSEQERAVDDLLVERLARLFTTHTMQIHMPQTAIDDVKRSIEEGRKKRKKMLLPLLLFFGLKKSALTAIAIGALTLLVLKALLVGKIAVLISSIIGLKKLLSPHSQTYEIVAHPHHTFSSTYDEHGHFARSIDSEETPKDQDLAYSSSKPVDSTT